MNALAPVFRHFSLPLCSQVQEHSSCRQVCRLRPALNLAQAIRFFGIFVLCSVLLACGEEHRGPLKPNLETIQTEIFDVACVECHNSSYAAGNLDLSNMQSSYAGLVGKRTNNSVAFENGWMRVKPGKPNLSFLLRKIRLPGVGEGSPMPPGNEELTDECVDLISTWIEQMATQEGAP
ncbi:MAG: hypothetical protein QGI45_12770 [Myxococcota bacterium]|nr:hypothetical protein [Myxococcota bacterium]